MAAETLDADPVLVLDRFSEEVQLACPLFQRRYVWTKLNINQLFDDIQTVVDGEYSKRFLGALVLDIESAPRSSRAGRYWIIDGQQRLTTLYLSLVAIADVAADLGEVAGSLARDTFNDYLVSTKSQTKGQPRLRPTLTDTRQFETILYQVSQKVGYSPVTVAPALAAGDKDGRMSQGYAEIRKQVAARLQVQDGSASHPLPPKDAAETLEALRAVLLEQLEFVEIRLGDEHDPNEVFDRLNKEGERLGLVDLIRNDVLKHLDRDPREAQEAFSNDWLPFEQAFEDDAAKAKYFFPFTLTLDETVTQATTFKALSQRLEKESEDEPAAARVQAMVRVLRRHLNAYNAVHSGRLSFVDEPAKEQVRRLVALNRPSSVYPYVMQLLTATAEGSVETTQAAACLAVIESFLVRRAVCGIEPTGLHAVFKKLWKSAGGDPAKVRSGIVSKTVLFPDDKAFESAIRVGDLYHRKVCTYLIEEYERRYTTGDVLSTFPPITVDHVMPQTLKGTWKELFTDQEHAQLLHTWGNLVPCRAKLTAQRARAAGRSRERNLATRLSFRQPSTSMTPTPSGRPRASRAARRTSWNGRSLDGRTTHPSKTPPHRNLPKRRTESRALSRRPDASLSARLRTASRALRVATRWPPATLDPATPARWPAPLSGRCLSCGLT